MAAALTENGAAAGTRIWDDAYMRSNERKHVVDRRDTVASDLLIEELGFIFVDGRCRQ